MLNRTSSPDHATLRGEEQGGTPKISASGDGAALPTIAAAATTLPPHERSSARVSSDSPTSARGVTRAAAERAHLEQVLRHRAASNARAAPDPLPARAEVRMDGRRYALAADEHGEFPRLVAAPGATCEVAVTYGTGDPSLPGELIVQVEDGGDLGEGGTAAAYPFDETGAARFQFVASRQRGHHRLTLRRGTDTKTLDIWIEPRED